MKFQCPKCNAILVSDEVTDGMKAACPECGSEIECHPLVIKPKLTLVSLPPEDRGADASLPRSIHTKMASAIGIEKLKGFKLSDLFSEVFSRHSREDVENYFTVGTAKSTPDILSVDAAWPKPWIFTRMMIASLILYFLFWIGWGIWNNTNLLPGLMMIGSFAIPISTLVLFIELNVRRNVSLYMVARLAFLGGIFSMLITHLLPVVPELLSLMLPDWSELLDDSVAGPLEETAKVLAMVAVASVSRYRYKLNGLLVGAAVGAGFSSFESAGYAFNVLLEGGGVDSMVRNINIRGLMSPLGHVVWSAIAGCAFWRVANGQKFRWSMLCDERFIRLFLVPVVLHMIWNSPWQLPYFGTFIGVGIVGWFVCLSLVQEGLHEIAAEQHEVRNISENGAVSERKGDVQ